MYVDINYLESVRTRFAQINAQELEDLVFVKDGKVVRFDQDCMEEFSFMGLLNTDIIKVFPYYPVEEEIKDD